MEPIEDQIDKKYFQLMKYCEQKELIEQAIQQLRTEIKTLNNELNDA